MSYAMVTVKVQLVAEDEKDVLRQLKEIYTFAEGKGMKGYIREVNVVM